MFDPFFPLALVFGPLALAFLLWGEAKRDTRRIWPRSISLLLAIPAALGLFSWSLMIAVIMFGEGMNPVGFQQASVFAASVAVFIIAASYGFVAYLRRQKN